MATITLTDRECYIVATAISLCPLAELGDRMDDGKDVPLQDLIALARKFNVTVANDMVMTRMVYERGGKSFRRKGEP